MRYKHNLRSLLISTLCCVALVALPLRVSLAEAVKVGVVGSAKGNVTATDAAGKQRALKTGDDIYQDDVIKTDASGNAQMLFLDKSALMVTPGSEVKIDSFVYDPATSKGGISLKEVKGAFRFIGGALSKEDHVEIKTPVSTIGIRGGIEETHISPKGDGADAIFIYGHDMTVSDKNGQKVVVAEFGSGVSVQKGLAAPVSMSPAAVEHKLEQFNAATKTVATEGDKSTDNKNEGSSDTKSGKDKNGKGDSSDKSKDKSTDSSGSSDSKSSSGNDSGGGTSSDSKSSSGGDSGSSSGAAASNSSSGGNSSSSSAATSATTSFTNTISNLTQATTATSSSDATKTSSQQSSSVPYTFGGYYNFASHTNFTSYSQGTAQYILSGNSLNAAFTRVNPTSGSQQYFTLPAPTATGFTNISTTLGGDAYSGAVYEATAGSMYYYYLLSADQTKQLSAVGGYMVSQANWVAAVQASSAAASATNGILFYHFLPDLAANAQNINDVNSFLNNASNSSLNFSGQGNGGGNLAVNWATNKYFGGGIDWYHGSGSTDHANMTVIYGNVTPTGSTLMSGVVADYDGISSSSVSTSNRGNYYDGFNRVASQVYAPNGTGAISGFVIDALEPSPGATIASDPYQTAGKQILAPATMVTPSADAISSAATTTSGTLYGYAGGHVVDNTPVAAAYWNTSMNDVVVHKDANAGTVGATIKITNIDSPSNDLTSTFGTDSATPGKSVLLDDKIFAAQQGSAKVSAAAPITDGALQQGVFVGADVIARVTHKCTQCDFVQWGVWASEVNSGTTASPSLQTVDMVPVVFGSPTAYSDLTNVGGTIHALGNVTYSGAVYGSVYNVAANTLTHQDGSFTSVIDLTNQSLVSLNATIGSMDFATTGAMPVTNQTYSGGSGAGFSAVSVTGSGGTNGHINGTLFGPNAENLGGNFDITQSSTTNRATGIYLGSRPH